MTLHLVDVSRYQVERTDPLDLAKAYTAGYRIANIALTGGRGYVSGAWATEYANRAHDLGMGISFYHWLDGRTPGQVQAARSLERMHAITGGLTGFAHIVDVEETGANGITPPTWTHVREYVEYIQAVLGRHMVIYTGDWWWSPKGWAGSSLTPYVHAAPNAGYQAGFPGVASEMWTAGYGGWSNLSIMQWGTQPLPGTGRCSLSALRDHGVWADIAGGDQIMPTADPGNAQPEAWAGPPVAADYLAELDALARDMARTAAPQTGSDDVADLVRWLADREYDIPSDILSIIPARAGETCAPVINAEMSDWIALGGKSSGCVGDENHGTGFHRGASFVPSTDYSRRRDPNGSDGPFVSWNYACAGDFHHGGNATLRKLHKAVLALLRAGAFPMICEMIVQPDAGKPVMYWARWEGVNSLREYTGSGHDLWSHISWYRSKADQRSYMWKEVTQVASLDATDKKWLVGAEFTGAVAAAVEKAIFAHKIDPAGTLNPNRTLDTFAKDVQNLRDHLVHALNDTRVLNRPLTGSALDVLVKAASSTSSALAALSQQIAAAEAAQADRDQATVSAVLQALAEIRADATDPVTTEELHAALERVYGDAFRRAVES